MKHLKYNFLKATLVLSAISAATIFSCCTTNRSEIKQTSEKPIKQIVDDFQISNLTGRQVLVMGQPLSVELKSSKPIVIDSVKATIDGKKAELEKKLETQYTLINPLDRCGQRKVLLTIFHSDSLHETEFLEILSLPKEEPKTIKYKLIRKFFHDKEAYTQGLIYHKGFLYESTGKERQSSVRCLDPVNGKVLRKKDLDPEYFGEGIALLGNEIYMLTYKSQLVFVFDLETFAQKRSYDLQTREGWGLTTNGKSLISSDGSASLYFFEPEYFTLVEQREVCNNKGLVNYLNELELTPFGLFANIYGEDQIALIDEKTGIIKGIADLSNLFPENLPKDIDHVLNGIAYNPESKTFYVTGKWWPVMYEISLLID